MAEQLSRKQQCVSSNLTIASRYGPRSRHRSSKPNLQELGGKARGSTPPRASKIINGCVAQAELEQASHKREVGGSTPPTARSFSICHWTFSICHLEKPVNGFVRRERLRCSEN